MRAHNAWSFKIGRIAKGEPATDKDTSDTTWPLESCKRKAGRTPACRSPIFFGMPLGSMAMADRHDSIGDLDPIQHRGWPNAILAEAGAVRHACGMARRETNPTWDHSGEPCAGIPSRTLRRVARAVPLFTGRRFPMFLARNASCAPDGARLRRMWWNDARLRLPARLRCGQGRS